MNGKTKAAGCEDTKAVQQNIFKFNFTQSFVILKAACFRVAPPWLSFLGGVIL
jgi:hypothetical protein